MYKPVARRRPELLLELDPERRDARRGRPAQPLVLPARRGLEPGRQARQPDLQRHHGHRRRHPERRQDLLQRDAVQDDRHDVPASTARATLTAAKNLFPANCAAFNTVKAAWDAVSVPAQAADPTCTIAGATTVTNPGNQTGSVGTPRLAADDRDRRQRRRTPGRPPGLPAGLTINASTGLISGTPTTAATYTTIVTATSNGTSQHATFTWTIAAEVGLRQPGQKLGNPGFESGDGAVDRDGGRHRQHLRSDRRTAAPGTPGWTATAPPTPTRSSRRSTIPAGCTNYTPLLLAAHRLGRDDHDRRLRQAHGDARRHDAGDLLEPQQGRPATP